MYFIPKVKVIVENTRENTDIYNGLKVMFNTSFEFTLNLYRLHV